MLTISNSLTRVQPVLKTQTVKLNKFEPPVEEKGKKMFKILVVITMGTYSTEAKSAAMQLIEFDTLPQAQKALKELTSSHSPDTKVIPLW